MCLRSRRPAGRRASAISHEQDRRSGASRRWQRLVVAPLDALFTAVARSRPLVGGRGTFLVAFRRYLGDPLALPDGTVIHRGDRLCEIHFWNRRLAERRGPSAGKVTWRIIRDFRSDLGVLAQMVTSGVLGDVRAVYAASPLAHGSARFGFFVRPLPPGLRRSLLTAWQTGVRRTFRPKAVRTELDSPTAEMWMSRGQLLRQYAASSATSGGVDGVPAAGTRRSHDIRVGPGGTYL